MAERFGLGDQVRQPLQQVFARWDGKGVPRGVSGEDIALTMRLFHLADTVEVHHRTRGLDDAVGVARARRGKHFDPRSSTCSAGSPARCSGTRRTSRTGRPSSPRSRHFSTA